MRRIYIGIDNGIDGAMTALDEAGFIASVRTPACSAGRGSSRRLDPYRCYNELYFLVEKARAQGNPDGPVTLLLEPAAKFSPGGNAIASTHHSAGIWFAIASIMPMAVRLLRYHEVAATTWQADVLGKFPKGESKAAAEAVARRLFPAVLDRLPPQGPRTPRPHDGAIDALLIAEWGRRKNI